MRKYDWAKHIEAWEQSGLSQAAYCRRERLSAVYFSQRLRAHREAFGVGRQALIPVRVEAPPGSTGCLVLHWGQGGQLNLPTSVSPRWLAELLQCLG